MHARFEGANFSRRIWRNSDILAGNLKHELAITIATGRNVHKTAQLIRERFNTNQYYAERLIRTETNHFHNAAELESYKDMGFEWFRFMATLDNRTNEICQKMDGKKYKVKDGIPGENMPPMHPNCRSTIVPWFKDYEPKTRVYRDDSPGENKHTRMISYETWRESLDINKERVAGFGETGLREDKNNNFSISTGFNDEYIGRNYGEIEKEIRYDPFENLLIYNEKGKIVFAEMGDEGAVGSPEALDFLSKGNYSVSHNHPKCFTFSIENIATASRYNLSEIRVVTAYRNFILRPITKWPDISFLEKKRGALVEATWRGNQCQIPKEWCYSFSK